MTRRRWLFGDQLGPHFLDDDNQQVLLVESRRVFARRRFHRQKAHLVLSAMRHRAAELGDRCTYVRSEHLPRGPAGVDEPLDVVQPTSWAALHLVNALAKSATSPGCPPAATRPAGPTSPPGPPAAGGAGC